MYYDFEVPLPDAPGKLAYDVNFLLFYALKSHFCAT